MKKNALLILCIILAFLVAALGGYIIYDKEYKSKNALTPESNYNTDVNDNTNTKPTENDESELPLNGEIKVVSDGTTATVNLNGEKFHANISNGELYFNINGKSGKYTALNNIKKIRCYMYGTSVRAEVFLITESGKVYSTIDYLEDDMNFKETEIFKNYEVEDILSKKGEVKEEFKVLLKSGKTITVTRSMDE